MTAALSMIRKSMPSSGSTRGGNRFSLGQARKRVCSEIMLKQQDEITIQSSRIMI
jgi:hypothetical protein